MTPLCRFPQRYQYPIRHNIDILTHSRIKAWAESLDPEAKSGVCTCRMELTIQGLLADDLSCSQIRFLGDPTGQFTEALDLSFDSVGIFGNIRSKRYALLVENGKVKEAFVEPDNVGVNGEYPCFLPEKDVAK